MTSFYPLPQEYKHFFNCVPAVMSEYWSNVWGSGVLLLYLACITTVLSCSCHKQHWMLLFTTSQDDLLQPTPTGKMNKSW